jgi:site-specific DNA recombinase
MDATKRVGIWIRVSTEMQVENESAEHHEQRARYYAQAKGWEIVEVYRLEAISGKSVIDHPETKRMLKDIREKRITGLIFSKLARLARNTKELLEFADIFRKEGSDLVSLSENIDTSSPAGRLFYTMIAAMATWEREEIAERVAASVPIRAKMGKPLGGAASFGYKWQGKEIIIDEREAPIRKLIYEIFLKTRRKKATAAELNKLGYRTRNGSKFSDTTVDRLIRDTSAKGIRRINYTKSIGEGRKWVLKDEKDWVLLPCPALITEELWAQCNGILDAQYKKREKVGPRVVFLLAGYVTCHCGRKMYVYHNNTKTYSCRVCKNRISVADIDEIYREQLKSFLLTDADIETFMRKSDEFITEKQELLARLQDEHKKLHKQLTEYVTLRVDKELTQDRFKELYDPLEERLKQIEVQLPELEAEIDFLKIQYLSSDTIISDAKDLYDRWDMLPFEERRNIVEMITEHIVIDKQDITIKLSYLPTPLPSKTEGLSNTNMPMWFL